MKKAIMNSKAQKIMRKILTKVLYRPSFKFPSFSEINDEHIENYYGINSDSVYNNSMYWTPKFYPPFNLSIPFQNEIHKLSKLKYFSDIDKLALTQLLIIESLRDTTYSYTINHVVDYKIPPYFNGNLNMLIYEKENSVPIIPLLITQVSPFMDSKLYVDNFKLSSAVAAGLYALEINHALKSNIFHSNVFVTSGFIWQMLEIHKDHIRKTPFLKPKENVNSLLINTCPNYADLFFQDIDHIKSIIGLIRYGLNIYETAVDSSVKLEKSEPKRLSFQFEKKINKLSM